MFKPAVEFSKISSYPEDKPSKNDQGGFDHKKFTGKIIFAEIAKTMY
jgi:hypothetical protein